MIALLSVLALLAAADAPGGWPELFPKLGNFSQVASPPMVAKGDKPEVYSQSVKYDWMGGRFEVITITVSRDPKIKARYTAEAFKKSDPSPQSFEVNKKPAWVWNFDKIDKLEQVRKRLVVVLADDTLLMLEQRGAGLDLEEVAKQFDFDAVVKALKTPPATKKE